jgi:DNA-binding CsgD family transcriptional regulator
MAARPTLVGREAERRRLEEGLGRARAGAGSLVLIAGEAGVGKTRLLQELAAGPGAVVLWGGASRGTAGAYGPVVAALRSRLRERPDALDGCGPLGAQLAAILPELGGPAPDADPATLHEAVRDALAHLAADGPVLLVLDDLQWSDDASLELLGWIAEPLERLPVLAVAAYRSDGLPREHRLRRLRHDLRRGGRLDELTLAPLAPEETAELVGRLLGDDPPAGLAAAIHDRAQGVPFFVEELARASAAEPGDAAADLPETVRDAVLIGVADLSQEARGAAEVAAVAGDSFDLELVAGLAGHEPLGELLDAGLACEAGEGTGAFRHALAREALYADVPWLRRRALHRRLAEALEAGGAPSLEIAVHWLGARDGARAREALLRAAAEARAVHAHRDAARAGREALELWPEGEEQERRIATLEWYADSAELSGELAEAVRALREICALRADVGPAEELAAAERRLAGVHELRGERESAIAARRAAATAFASAGRPADAAVERLAAANHFRSTAAYTPAIELARAAGQEAERAGRQDLRARALGLEGVALAKRGDAGAGVEAVRAGLALALARDMTPVAAELFQRLSLVLYDGADYPRAEAALDSALELCRTGDQPGTELACVTCLVYVLRERGDWTRAVTMGRDLIASGSGVWVAEGLVGAIQGFQGRFGPARRLLTSSLASSSRVGHFNMTVDSTAALAWLAAAEGDDDQAAARCGEVLARWERSEDNHYALRGLRWASGFFARRGDPASAQGCAEALAEIAARTGHPDALAALAQAIGEAALAEGDAATAAEQLGRAVEIHRGLDLPYERAEIELRAGVALAAAGEREPALERLAAAHRTARRLGARPLAAEAAREVAALGEEVGSVLGGRASAEADGAGLSRRELEVVRLVAEGRTNREIASELYLSPRTVDMHVRSILRRLDCRSRLEAARRAGELGLLAARSRDDRAAPAIDDP